MTATSKELKIALRSLRILEEAVAALREQLTAANPELLSVTAPTYTGRIAVLQAEIAAYLSSHPSDVSRLAMALPVRQGIHIDYATEMLA